MSEELPVTVTSLVSDQGSIIVLSGETEDGRTVTFGADRRMAVPIIEALTFEEERPVALVSPWQILGAIS